MNKNTRKWFNDHSYLFLGDRDLECDMCGVVRNLQFHHIVSLKNGGKNESNNLQILCPSCHSIVHGFKFFSLIDEMNYLKNDEDFIKTYFNWANRRKTTPEFCEFLSLSKNNTYKRIRAFELIKKIKHARSTNSPYLCSEVLA